MAALLLSAGVARADVMVLRSAQNSATQTRTLRIPRTGSFTMDGGSSGYLVVGVAVPDISYAVGSAVWTTTSPASTSQALSSQVSRHGDDGVSTCRTELWSLSRPVTGQGFLTVNLKIVAGSPAPTSIAGTMISLANVRATSIGGVPCCEGAANAGSGTTIISKTMSDTSRGDALVNAVCTSWTGPAPGMPSADPAEDPEMVPRSFQQTISPNLQHFAGTSPGGEADAPATRFRHLRWLQSGSRVWAIVGLELFAVRTVETPDAAPPLPPDAAPPLPADAAPPLLPDAAPPLPPDAAVSPDARVPAPDAAPAADEPPLLPPDPPPPRLDGNLTAVPAPDAGAPIIDELVDAGVAPGEPRDVDLRVGCACRLGGRGAGGGWLMTLAIALVLRRRLRVPQRRC